MTEPTSTGPRGSTMLVCGTLIVLACIGAVVYLTASNRPTEVALAFMGPIVLTVLAATYNAQKLDRVETKVDRAVEQTNGGLDARIHAASAKAVEQALRGAGLPPVQPGTAAITQNQES